MRKKLNSKWCVTLISLLLVMSFTNLVVSASYLTMEDRHRGGYNLHPSHRIFESIIDKGINETSIVGAAALELIKRNPGILSSRRTPTNNSFSQLKTGNTVEVFVSGAEELGFVAELGDDQLEKIFFIPCCINEMPHSLLLIRYKDGREKGSIFTKEEFTELCEELVSNELLTAEESVRLQQKLTYQNLKEYRQLRFIDTSDEGVQALMAFLGKIGAQKLSQGFQRKVSAKRILLAEQAILYEGCTVLAEARDAKMRAESIFEEMLIGRGAEYSAFETAFAQFWELWERDRTEEFDPGAVNPKLKLLVRDIERGLGHASNEGFIEFRDEAYERMFDLKGVEIHDCAETIADLKRIFRQVALHEMPQALRDQYELHCQRVKLKRLVADEKYRKAAKVKLLIAAAEDKLKIKPEDRESNDLHYAELFERIPGLNPDKIIVTNFSKCLLPTDITSEDGTVKINENHVKLMQLMSHKGMRCEIHDFPRSYPPKVIGELYSSVMYSLAIHTLRGHFPFNESGLMVFNPDELTAQGERGRNHLYVNLLATLYYWIMLVEAHPYFTERARFFIEKYPEVFQNLTKEERKKLPDHLLWLVYALDKKGAFPFPGYEVKTGWTRQDVDELMRSYPNCVFNEGASDSKTDGDESAMPQLLPARVFRLLSSKGSSMTVKDISDELKDAESVDISSCLDILTKVCVVAAGEEGKSYKAVLMSPERESKVEEILGKKEIKSEDDLVEIRGKIFEVIEPVQVDGLIEVTREEKQKIIIALETDWIPEKCESGIDELNVLIQKLKDLENMGAVKIVRGTAETLAGDVQTTIEEEKVPHGNVIVLAGEDTIKDPGFSFIKAKAFFAGINTGALNQDELKKDEVYYIRILEMITLAMRLASNKPTIPSNFNIDFQSMGARTYLFTLRAERINFNDAKKVYELQLEFLIKA